MKDRRIRNIWKSCLAILLLGGFLVSGPAQSQSWFTWKAQKTESNEVYVKQGQVKPKRTWFEYFFGEENNMAPQGQQVYLRQGGAQPSIKGEKTIADYEVDTVEEMLARGRQLSLPHQPGLMKLAAQGRANAMEAERRHRMRMIELQAKSRRETLAAQKQEAIGQMSTSPKPDDKVIYIRPGMVKPPKVFTDYE
jgi:hypothetical protein